jgi:hypothetical protein
MRAVRQQERGEGLTQRKWREVAAFGSPGLGRATVRSSVHACWTGCVLDFGEVIHEWCRVQAA